MKISKKLVIITITACLALCGVGCGFFRNFFNTPPKNIIFIVLDTTRADHLSPYNYERDTTPALKKFADESMIFERAMATAPWTPPSIAGMFTGRYPSSHGLMPPNDQEIAKAESARLDSKLTTMAELLKEKGYNTIGITPNPWTSSEFGFGQGFDIYSFRTRAEAREITRAGMKVLTGRENATTPFFLFLHYLDPHGPYEAPPPYKTMYTKPPVNRAYSNAGHALDFLNSYDGELSYLDHYLGIFFEFLKNKNLYDSTLIVIVGDHGEQFCERGDSGHGFKLFDEELRVPLIVRAPKRTAERLDYTVSNLDVFATVLDYAGIAVPPTSQSISLFNEKELLQRPGVTSEINRKVNWKSFTSLEGKKLIMDFGPLDNVSATNPPAIIGLYDPVNDPFENTILKNEVTTKNLFTHYEEQRRKTLEDKIITEKAPVNNETIEQLRSLGYLK
jgi:arylsulfatase A-like enzyme